MTGVIIKRLLSGGMHMKKITLSLILFSLILGRAFSQENVVIETEIIDSSRYDNLKNEAYFGVGTPSLIGLLSGTFFAIAEAIEQADKPEDEKEVTAISLNLGYNHFFWNHLGLGAFINYEKMGQFDLFSTQAKLSVQYGWRHFKFYHAVSGGVLFMENTQPIPMYDVTILGLKFDVDDMNIFVEGSFPSTGLLKIGASYKF